MTRPTFLVFPGEGEGEWRRGGGGGEEGLVDLIAAHDFGALFCHPSHTKIFFYKICDLPNPAKPIGCSLAPYNSLLKVVQPRKVQEKAKQF